MKQNFRKIERNSGTTDFSKFSSFNRGSFQSSSAERHKAKCADCGNDCEVPFKPVEGRPVYCRECYGKHRPQRF